MHQLTIKNSVFELPLFSGVKDLLIVGNASIVVERSFDGEAYYPLTDNAGNEIAPLQNPGVIYNAQIENLSRSVKLRLRLLSGSAKVEIA